MLFLACGDLPALRDGIHFKRQKSLLFRIASLRFEQNEVASVIWSRFVPIPYPTRIIRSACAQERRLAFSAATAAIMSGLASVQLFLHLRYSPRVARRASRLQKREI
jgi:hypothetical protein